MNAIEKLKASPVEYLGQRVITLGMMDDAHGRPDGAARKAFGRNREKLEEGRHYFRGSSVLRTTSGRGDDVLLTERGYLVLVKTFRDELAWKVQEQLVDGYFRAQAIELDPGLRGILFLQGAVSEMRREVRVLTRATEERFGDLERQLKHLRAGARVQATGRRGGSERKVKPRATAALVALPFLNGGKG